MSHFVYHPNHAPVIVEAEEYQKYLDNGWYDTPAKFPEKALALEEKVEPESEPEVAEIPKKKGRPPKVKAEEGSAAIEV